MPHLNFKNIEIEKVQELSLKLDVVLSQAFNCPVEDITFDVINNTSILKGEIISGDQTIVIQMFERPTENIEQVVSILTAYFKEVTIIFELIKPHLYYENGVNFS